MGVRPLGHIGRVRCGMGAALATAGDVAHVAQMWSVV